MGSGVRRPGRDGAAEVDLVTVVGSSLIRAYGWELDTGSKDTGLLQLGFSNGSRWYYQGVPEKLFEDFLFSDSKGEFFHKHFKGKFDEMPADEVEQNLSGATPR
jgi:hypothetical protein